MSDERPTNDDPAVVGVPPETPAEVRPSATGVVAGPVDGETDVVVADVAGPGRAADREPGEFDDRTLEDAEGGVEGSTLDDPGDSAVDN
ncbi:MAG: hypothetical protein ACR2HP_03970 [Ilumatobacteraceae bacterium]